MHLSASGGQPALHDIARSSRMQSPVRSWKKEALLPPTDFPQFAGMFSIERVWEIESESERERESEWVSECVSDWRVSERASIKTQQCVKVCVCKFSAPFPPCFSLHQGRLEVLELAEGMQNQHSRRWTFEFCCAGLERCDVLHHSGFSAISYSFFGVSASHRNHLRRVGRAMDVEKMQMQRSRRRRLQPATKPRATGRQVRHGATWCHFLFFSWVFWSLCFRLTETPSNSWAVGLKLPCTCAWCWVPGRCRQADRPGLWRHYWENDQIGTRRKTSCPGTSGEISTARCLDLPTWLSLNTSSPCPSWGQQTSSSTCPWRPEMKDLP